MPMFHCPACLKSSPKGRVSHEWTVQDWDAEPLVWGWRCENCGYFKKPRAKQDRTSYDFITKHATSDEKLSNRNAVLFHSFNPNGLVALKRAMDKRVDRAIEDTGCPNGVLFVYGGLNDFSWKRFNALREKKASVTSTDVYVAVKMAKDDLAKAEAWIAEVYAKHGMTPPAA